MRTGAISDSVSKYGRICAEPRAQLRPIDKRFGVWAIEIQNASVVWPDKVRPL